MLGLPPHPQPPWPTEDVTDALAVDYDFTEFDSWKTLFDLAEKHQRKFYIKQFLRGCPVGRYEVVSVSPTEVATDCPVILFNSGGLYGENAGNLGGSLILKFYPPIQRTIVDMYCFGEPEVK
jgi:hypothetical protein